MSAISRASVGVAAAAAARRNASATGPRPRNAISEGVRGRTARSPARVVGSVEAGLARTDEAVPRDLGGPVEDDELSAAEGDLDPTSGVGIPCERPTPDAIERLFRTWSRPGCRRR
jgi:hypothetical protein